MHEKKISDMLDMRHEIRREDSNRNVVGGNKAFVEKFVSSPTEGRVQNWLLIILVMSWTVAQCGYAWADPV